jgi:hypothetical protein
LKERCVDRLQANDEHGGLDAPIWGAVLLLLFGLFFTGYASYHALALFRGQVQQDLDQATRLAAAQLQPGTALAGQAGVDPQAASQVWSAVLPPLLATLPSDVSTGPWATVTLQAYEQAGGTTPDPPGWAVSGPGVFAEIAAPVQARLFGLAPITFTMTVAAFELAPVRDTQTQTWQNGG